MTGLLPYRPPYDWDGVHRYFAARAIPGVEVVLPGLYARTIVAAGVHGTLTVTPADTDALLATLRPPGLVQGPDIGARIRRAFDLDADPASIGAALSVDPFMAGLVAACPGLRVPGAWDGFELAVRAILGQQVSVAAATRLAGRLVVAFGTPLSLRGVVTEPGLSHVFPSPEDLVEADISLVLNMPRSRGAAIRAVAAAALAEPDLFAPNQGLAESVARLKALQGIGDWTAQYIAMRALREPDALPTGDIGLLRALDDGEGRPGARALEERAAAWRPYRSYATLHLWTHDAARLAARRQEETNAGARAGMRPRRRPARMIP